MVVEEMRGHEDGRTRLILSIIAVSEAATPTALIPIVEEWAREAGAVVCPRYQSHLYVTAEVEMAPACALRLHTSLKDGLQALWLEEFGCDVNVLARPGEVAVDRRLFVFDLDSTLIQMEGVDEMARIAGVYERVAVGEGEGRHSLLWTRRLRSGRWGGAWTLKSRWPND